MSEYTVEEMKKAIKEEIKWEIKRLNIIGYINIGIAVLTIILFFIKPTLFLLIPLFLLSGSFIRISAKGNALIKLNNDKNIDEIIKAAMIQKGIYKKKDL